MSNSLLGRSMKRCFVKGIACKYLNIDRVTIYTNSRPPTSGEVQAAKTLEKEKQIVFENHRHEITKNHLHGVARTGTPSAKEVWFCTAKLPVVQLIGESYEIPFRHKNCHRKRYTDDRPSTEQLRKNHEEK